MSKKLWVPVKESTDAHKFNEEKVNSLNQQFKYRSTAAASPEEVVREVYNLTGESLFFRAYGWAAHKAWAYHPRHPTMPGRVYGMNHWLYRELKPEEWLYFPHFFYIGETKSGRPGKILQIFGDNMFTGERNPSRPEAKSNKFFV